MCRIAHRKLTFCEGSLALAYYGRGSAYSELGQFERAIEEYSGAIELDPQYAWAYACRGVAYCQLGQLEQAIEDCDEAIRLDPSDAVACP